MANIIKCTQCHIVNEELHGIQTGGSSASSEETVG